MKLMTNEKYNALMRALRLQNKTIEKLTNENKSLKRELGRCELMRNLERGITYGVIFPNTDERGLGDSGTPTIFPDMF